MMTRPYLGKHLEPKKRPSTYKVCYLHLWIHPDTTFELMSKPRTLTQSLKCHADENIISFQVV
ncbi:hypothetical protein AKJ16_DCAP17990 [Drosera capensis]